MRTIPFGEAFTQVYNATAVRVDDSELLYPDCNEDDMSITLNSEHGHDIVIPSTDCATVTNDGELMFKDDNGEDVTLMLLTVKLVK